MNKLSRTRTAPRSDTTLKAYINEITVSRVFNYTGFLKATSGRIVFRILASTSGNIVNKVSTCMGSRKDNKSNSSCTSPSSLTMLCTLCSKMDKLRGNLMDKPTNRAGLNTPVNCCKAIKGRRGTIRQTNRSNMFITDSRDPMLPFKARQRTDDNRFSCQINLRILSFMTMTITRSICKRKMTIIWILPMSITITAKKSNTRITTTRLKRTSSIMAPKANRSILSPQNISKWECTPFTTSNRRMVLDSRSTILIKEAPIKVSSNKHMLPIVCSCRAASNLSSSLTIVMTKQPPLTNSRGNRQLNSEKHPIVRNSSKYSRLLRTLSKQLPPATSKVNSSRHSNSKQTNKTTTATNMSRKRFLSSRTQLLRLQTSSKSRM